MNKFSVRALALAACLSSFALPASAEWIGTYQSTEATKGALGQTWTGAWADGWNVAEAPSDMTIDGGTLSYWYLGGGYWYGTMTQTYVFTTTAARTESLTLGIDLSSNEQWDGSATSMYIWQGSTANKTLLAGATADEIEHASYTLDLQAGQEWGFMAVSGSAGDQSYKTGRVYGSFTITDPATPVDNGGDVPEPASLALLGLGMLGIAGVRRKKA
jgi:hypothetical protein